MKLKAVIVDLDGTLCDVKHRLHFIKNKPPEWDKFHEACVNDPVNQWCKSLVNSYHGTDVIVIYMTGRPIKYMAETEKWIKDNVGESNYMIMMKPDGDYRKDYEFKEEMFYKHIDGEYDVLIAMDDRTETIEMWRKHDIFTLHYSS